MFIIINVGMCVSVYVQVYSGITPVYRLENFNQTWYKRVEGEGKYMI